MTKYDVVANKENRFPILQETKVSYKDEITASNPETVVNVLNKLFQANERCEEHIYLLCFNAKNTVIGAFEVGIGGMDACIVDPKNIFIRALLCGAVSIILAHNHPSGNPEPSAADIQLTKRIKEAADILNINLLDHVVIGFDNYKSIARMGMI